MKNALLRLKRQADRSRFFQNTFIGDQSILPADFREKYGRHLSEKVRGFGYWVWKPQVIKQTLSKLNENEFLVYLDAGCHINPKGLKRLAEYCDLLLESDSAVLAFEFGGLPERHWTKGDVFDFFNCRHNQDITQSAQVQAGVIILKKCEKADRFIEDWEKVYEQGFHLVDDSPSVSDNLPGFKEHRHDQSIFSILCKQHGYISVGGREIYANDGNWDRLSNFPFWVKRDRGIRQTNFIILARFVMRNLKQTIKRNN